jgi:hypothetical protein
VAETPQWFTSEVLRFLNGWHRGAKPGQYYARCPAHDDRRASLGIRPGDKLDVVWNCQAGCSVEDVRAALIGLGIDEDYLGEYGTPKYEARRHARAASDDWRQIERLRNEMIDLKGSLRELLSADLTLAMLKVRLLAVAEGVVFPVDQKGYVAFAIRAGVSRPRAYAAWKADPLAVQAQPQCVTEDHVVLTQPGENRQAAQVAEDDGILGTRQPISERDKIPGSLSRNETAEIDAAIAALRDGGLTGGNEAA